MGAEPAPPIHSRRGREAPQAKEKEDSHSSGRRTRERRLQLPSKRVRQEVSMERCRQDPRAPSGGDNGVKEAAKATGTQIRDGPMRKFLSRVGSTGFIGERDNGQLKGPNERANESFTGNGVRRGEERVEESASDQTREVDGNPMEPADPDCCYTSRVYVLEYLTHLRRTLS